VRHSYVRVDGTWRVAGRANVFAVGDLAAKPPGQQLGSYAHWEAEYVASELKRAWRRAPAAPRAYTPPPQLVNVSLGPRNGLFLYDGVLLLSGAPAAVLKAITQRWFVALLPIPYPLLRHLPRVHTRDDDAPPATATAAAAGGAAPQAA
jgi:NADH dehydrogenase FAD-containing subunit